MQTLREQGLSEEEETQPQANWDDSRPWRTTGSGRPARKEGERLPEVEGVVGDSGVSEYSEVLSSKRRFQAGAIGGVSAEEAGEKEAEEKGFIGEKILNILFNNDPTSDHARWSTGQDQQSIKKGRSKSRH